MTRQEVEERIRENDGSWIAPHQLVFTMDGEDKTIHVRSADGMNGFLIGMKSDWRDFYVSASFDLFDTEKMGSFLRFAKDLAEVLDVTLEIPGAKQVERVVKVQDREAEAHLTGKVEAYEKVLMGGRRDIEIHPAPYSSS